VPLAEKGVRGKGRQPLSPPQHTETRSAISAPKQRNGFHTSRPRFDSIGAKCRLFSGNCAYCSEVAARTDSQTI